MRNISFAWTTAALNARRKTVTRREWDDRYAQSFREGELLAAYDRQPRFGGKQIGVIRLTRKPYRESEAVMPDSDYEAEGFAYLDEHPYHKPKQWREVNLKEKFERDRKIGAVCWVVRFEIVSLVCEQGVTDGTLSR